MPNNLSLFPIQAPIGRFTDSAGNSYDVMMTMEYARALADLLDRVGGASSLTVSELSTLIMSAPIEGPKVAALQQLVAQLATELAAASLANARLAKLEQLVEDMARDRAPTSAGQVAALAREVKDFGRFVASYGPAPVDWEHPGKIGAKTASTGKFTTLTTTSYTNLSPSNENVEIKPTGTGSVTIAPAQSGAMDNVVLGATTPRDGHFQSVWIQYGFACNGAPPQGPHALGPAATDAASTQALANNLRAALIANGIGST